METENYTPRTLQEAITYYANPDNALAFMIRLRWPHGVTCPRCGSSEHSFLSTRRMWKCKGCKKHFSAKVGTIMEDSPLGLDKWLAAVWLITNAKNGISSYELHRSIGITQKSAWFVLHRVRAAMEAGSIEKKMVGEIEVDETFIGGLEKNKHSEKRRKMGRGAVGKAIVMGLLARDGSGKGATIVRAKVITGTDKATLHGEIAANVTEGSTVHTDAHPSYEGLSELEEKYVHEVINHSVEYVRGSVTTNRIENFFALLKRTLKGTYVSVEPYHLQSYLDEQIIRYNLRKGTDAERFQQVMSGAVGRRLTYKQLTARGDIDPS